MKPLKPIAWRARQQPPSTVRVVTSSGKELASRAISHPAPLNFGVCINNTRVKIGPLLRRRVGLPVQAIATVDDVIKQLRDRSRSGEIVVYSSGVGQ